MNTFLIYFFSILLTYFTTNKNEWEYLFNGENLDGWKIKIRGYKLGENYKNTFKVKDGSIKVSYENYESFNDKFGHIFFTNRKYKNYHLSLEYKFSGKHLKGAPGWSIKNSGVMIHCQDPETMLINQEFPISAEAQLLGGLGKNNRTTLNICTPGTDVDINSKKAIAHCINSNSNTYHKDSWVAIEIIVYSDSLIHHLIGYDTVLTYTNIRIGGDSVPINYSNKIGEPLEDGYISLQSEGHPVEFKNIKIKEIN